MTLLQFLLPPTHSFTYPFSLLLHSIMYRWMYTLHSFSRSSGRRAREKRISYISTSYKVVTILGYIYTYNNRLSIFLSLSVCVCVCVLISIHPSDGLYNRFVVTSFNSFFFSFSICSSDKQQPKPFHPPPSRQKPTSSTPEGDWIVLFLLC